MSLSFDTYFPLIAVILTIALLTIVWKYYSFSGFGRFIFIGLTFVICIQAFTMLEVVQIPDDFLIALYVLVAAGIFFLYYKNREQPTKINPKSQKLYSEKILEILIKATFDEEDKKDLKELRERLKLTSLEQKNIAQATLKSYIEMCILYDKLNPEALEKIAATARFFDVNNITDVIDGRQLHIWTTNWLIEEKNQLQQLPVSVNSLILQLGESMLWWSPATINQYQQLDEITEPIKPAVSVQITSGVVYKAGFINIKAAKSPYLQAVDTGKVYFTSCKIIFKSSKNNFNIDYDQLERVEITEAGLTLHIIGSDEPLYLELDNYEFPSTIIAFITKNSDFEVLPSNFAQIKARTTI